MEHRPRALGLHPLEHRDVYGPGRVVQRQEDDPLSAPDRRRLRGYLHPRHHHPRVVTLLPQVGRAHHTEIVQERLEERHDVPGRVHPEHLELRPNHLRIGVLGQVRVDRVVHCQCELLPFA